MTQKSSNDSRTRLADVILLVRDLYQEIEITEPPVLLLEKVLPAVAARLDTGGTKFIIHTAAKPWQPGTVSGMLTRYEHEAHIWYSLQMNTCLRRFVLCKELAHLLIDDGPKHYTRDPVALVQELINDVPIMTPEGDMESERMAAIAAIEILAPWKLRSFIPDASDRSVSDMEIPSRALSPRV